MNQLDIVYRELKKIIEKGYVKKNMDLTSYNTYRLYGVARIGVIINSIETFVKTMIVCDKNNIQPIIIGNGSNIIIASKMIESVVIIMGEQFSRVYELNGHIIAESGALLGAVVRCASDNGLTGMEGSVGIPGSVGGAVYMNASAYDYETSDVVSNVIVFSGGKIKELSREEINFGYRYSSLQDTGDIILRVEFRLKNEDKEIIKERIKDIIAKRCVKDKSSYPNAGSVFKNGNNYFAGELIDKCGLKNYNIGKAYVSNYHANLIENRGGAKAQDILGLIEYIRSEVFKKFGVKLELEQKVIGEENDIRRLSYS